MFAKLELVQLQQIWWVIVSVVGSLFLFLSFVQGGQTLLRSVAKNDLERSLVINSLGRKWELAFTTLVLFGGALFVAFPLFYATSFGGAYWMWISILFTFIVQAVSYKFRNKPNNFLGAKTYEFFLFLNGTLGILLIGVAIGTFFTGSDFQRNSYNLVTWQHPLRGLEAAFHPFNVCLGLFLVFLARILGALYLINNIALNTPQLEEMNKRLRRESFINLLLALPFLLYVLVSLLVMDGFAFDPASGQVFMEKEKYLHNLLALPLSLGLLVVGLLLVISGVLMTARFRGTTSGIWFAGPGAVLVGLALFSIAAFNNTPFYPSKFDLQSSLSIKNASSSHYTLAIMSYAALIIPFVLAYVTYVWRLVDGEKLTSAEVSDGSSREIY